MQKFVSFLLMFVMFLSSTVFAYPKTLVPEGLEYVDEFVILEDNDSVISVMARLGDVTSIVTYEWDSNNVTMTTKELDPLTRSNNVIFETDFNLELDLHNNFEVLNTIDYEGSTYYLSDLPILDEYVDSKAATATIAIGAILGASLLNWLIAASLTIVIAGVTYVVLSTVSNELHNNKQRNHFMAAIRNGKLYVADGLTHSQAVARLKGKQDVWSVSSAHARGIANPGAIGPENHYKNGSSNDLFYWHYHLAGRIGGHSFYGFGLSGEK